MLTALFVIGLIWVGWELIILALKAAWGIAMILFSLVFLPVVLIGLVIAGLVHFALPILVIVGLVALINRKKSYE
ncbi:MAG: hypothetical protein K5767_08410 [Clostridia bacterium]|nr:hypothetical protein [Clostridia bacterium]